LLSHAVCTDEMPGLIVLRQEGDCIMGAANQSAIGTLVERRTRYLILIGVFHGKPTAEAMRDAITSTLQALPARLRRTLTWDQGKELALHQQITERTGTRVFVCDAHSPWQRGSNENMNGLLRDYVPRGTAWIPGNCARAAPRW
jgi:IS30 family transposase